MGNWKWEIKGHFAFRIKTKPRRFLSEGFVFLFGKN